MQIGDEVKSQTRLLDDVDSNVDVATAALQKEAKHAEQIRDKAQMCWMYICVAVEVIILFLLLVLTLAG
jgi:t-SNARE complex subunit (syntaxin)